VHEQLIHDGTLRFSKEKHGSCRQDVCQVSYHRSHLLPVMTTTVTMLAPRRQRIRSHITSWVMLSPATSPPFTPLPNEQALFTSPPRIALSISTPSHYPGKQQQPFSASSSTYEDHHDCICAMFIMLTETTVALYISRIAA
jgi:hypothetical protein